MDKIHIHTNARPWNKGKLIGQKPPLRLPEIWSIRIRLEMSNRGRDLALFNLVIDSKLRSSDMVKLRVSDVAHGKHILKRAMVMQQKTRTALTHWIEQANLSGSDYLFKG
jgi:site-specific recombinase XerC